MLSAASRRAHSRAALRPTPRVCKSAREWCPGAESPYVHNRMNLLWDLCAIFSPFQHACRRSFLYLFKIAQSLSSLLTGAARVRALVPYPSGRACTL
jgi:hypothetical protein